MYNQTLDLMKNSQRLKEKQLEELKDQVCGIPCYKCTAFIKATDDQNDKATASMTEE